jgi:hypothetical protein
MKIEWRQIEAVREGMTPYLTVGGALGMVIGVVGAVAIGILTGSLLVGATFGAVFFISGIVLLQLRHGKSGVEAAEVKCILFSKEEAKKRVNTEEGLDPGARELLMNYVRHRRSWPPAEFQRHLDLAKAHSLNPKEALACDNPISWILTYQEYMKHLANKFPGELKNEIHFLSSISYQNLEREGKEAKEQFKELTDSK